MKRHSDRGGVVHAPLRRAVVRTIKPRVSRQTWAVLRRLEPTRENWNDPWALLSELAATAGAPRMRRALSSVPGPLRGLVAEVSEILDRKPRAKVAILMDGPESPLADAIRARHPHVTVHAVQSSGGESVVHARLAATGRYDLIIDAVTDPDTAASRFRSLLFHLRRGGTLAIADFRSPVPPPHGVWPLLSRLVALRGDSSAVANRDDRALAQATGRMIVAQHHVLIRNGTQCLAKLRDAEVDLVLAVTGDRLGRVLERIEADRFTPRFTVRDHANETSVRDNAPIDVPPLSLREYYGVVCSPGQVVSKRNLLLPDTYRHHLHARLANHKTIEVGPRFAQLSADVRGAERLEGAYFHFASEWPGHYGHVLTEQVSRLWAWEAARARHPGLKVLVGRRPRAEGVLPFERAILEAVGVPGSDIVLMDRPVRVDCLLAATPMFSYPQYVSPRIADTWGAVAGQVAARADDRATPRRIFVGRERASRLCTNAAAVERLFADFGFVTVYPEHFSFVDQVEMFRNAEVVAGYAGSALFTLCFCAPGKRVLMLSSESYTANNEYLIAAVLGHEIDVFWSAAAERRPNADFEFDFAREGRQLAAVLAGLGPPGDRASRRDSMTSGRAVRS